MSKILVFCLSFNKNLSKATFCCLFFDRKENDLDFLVVLQYEMSKVPSVVDYFPIGNIQDHGILFSMGNVQDPVFFFVCQLEMRRILAFVFFNQRLAILHV